MTDIICIVEQQVKKLQKQIVEKGIFATKEERKYLDKYQDLLLRLYSKFEK